MKKLVALSMLLFASVPAGASVMIVGSAAKGCYEAASRGGLSRDALQVCNAAFETGLEGQDLVATHVNRGIVRVNSGDVRGAFSDFDRAIALDADHPEAYLNKAAAILRSSGDPDEALSLFAEALRKKTKRPELAHYGRAIAHEVRGDARAAYHEYRRALELAPRWADPVRELKRFRVSGG